MEFSIEDKFYGILFVNIFPGLLLLVELFLLFHFSAIELEQKITETIINLIGPIANNIVYVLGIFIILFVIAALLGHIIDEVRHFLFNDFSMKIDIIGCLVERCKKNEHDKQQEQLLEIYKYFQTSTWYPYEATGNITIAMSFGIFVFIRWFSLYKNVDYAFFIFLIFILYIIVCLMLFIVSLNILSVIQNVERKFYQSQEVEPNSRFQPLIDYFGSKIRTQETIHKKR